MVNSTSLFLSQSHTTNRQENARVVEMKSMKPMTPSRDTVFFVQLFARAYRHSS